MRNPADFDNILIRHYEKLEKVVTDPKWLPLPIVVATEAAKWLRRQQDYLETVKTSPQWKAHPADMEQVLKNTEQEIQWLMKKKLRRQGFRDYGEGHYGAVYPTQTQGIVCKITTDVSEAQFVANAISIGKWPHGIVRYYAIFKLEGSRARRRPVFILWRDEVDPPTLAEAETKNTYNEKMTHLLMAAKYIGAEIRLTITRNKPSPSILRQALDGDPQDWLLPDRYEHLDNYHRTLEYIGRLNKQRPKIVAKLSALLHCFRHCAQNMHLSYGFDPGNALEFYMQHGMILADVHGNNVMQKYETKENEWVISDPGHMIEITEEFRHVVVPAI